MKWFQVLILGVTLYAGVCDALECYDSTITPMFSSKNCTDTAEVNCVLIFLFANSGAPVLRIQGCYTEMKAKCDETNMYCVTCEGNKCNKDDATMTPVSCIKCSDTDTKCVKSVADIVDAEKGYLCSTIAVEQAATGGATAGADTQKVYHNIRGPVNTAAELNACRNLGAKSTLCNDADKCNVNELPERVKCGSDVCLKQSDACVALYDQNGKNKVVACKSEKDSDCANADYCVECTTADSCPTELKNMCYYCPNTADCSKIKNNQIKQCTNGTCFTKIEGDKSSRGCVAAADMDCKKHTCATCT